MIQENIPIASLLVSAPTSMILKGQTHVSIVYFPPALNLSLFIQNNAYESARWYLEFSGNHNGPRAIIIIDRDVAMIGPIHRMPN